MNTPTILEFHRGTFRFFRLFLTRLDRVFSNVEKFSITVRARISHTKRLKKKRQEGKFAHTRATCPLH